MQFQIHGMEWFVYSKGSFSLEISLKYSFNIKSGGITSAILFRMLNKTMDMFYAEE